MIMLMVTMSLQIYAAEQHDFSENEDMEIESLESEKTEETSEYTEYNMVYVNPLYEGIIQASDLEISEYDGIAAYTNAVYTSVEEAGEEFRLQMKRRQTDIMIDFWVDSYDKSIIEGYATQIVSSAVRHTANASEGDYLRWQYGGYRCNMRVNGNVATFIYTMTYYTTYEQEQKVDIEIGSLVNGLGLNTGSDYEKIQRIYDWICDNVKYDQVHVMDNTYLSQFTAYAALFDRTAVCQGYAVLFYRLAMEAGVDTRVIAGLGNGGAHGWNIVRLNDEYYNLDATWDAGARVYRYFLKSNTDFINHVRNSEYETEDFNADYPMSSQSYDREGEKDPVEEEKPEVPKEPVEDIPKEPEDNVPEEPPYNGLKYDDESGRWYWYKDGVVDTRYCDVVSHNGAWWYIRNGEIDFDYTGLAKNSNGWWYIDKGKVNFNYSSVVSHNGAWWYIKNGKLEFGYTGLAQNGNGWWYINKGKVNFNYNSVVPHNGAWWYIKNGKLEFGYTGLAQNGNGWWYIDKGKVNFNYNSVVPYNGAWWYIKNGKLDFGYTGLAQNSNGWWYIDKGKVNFNYNSVVLHNGAWWYIKNGKLDFGYTGLARNNNGWWYIEKGKVNFNYNSVVSYNGSWWYVKNGKLDAGYTGVGENENGWWYIRNGVLDWNYSGTVRYKGREYWVVKGRVNR